MSTFDLPGHSAHDEIRNIRTSQVRVTVLKPDGTPLTGQELVISQTRHKFLFGAGGFDIYETANAPDNASKTPIGQRVEKFTALFNAATLPFYWARFESERGQPLTRELTNAAQRCVDYGLQVKGHPLCWHTLAPDWLLPMSNAEILQAQLARIQREVGGFRGLIDTWDVLNEAVIMPVFDKYDNGLTRLCKELGRIETIRKVFDAARAANPSATLLLNDFDVSSAYDILVEGCLEAGIKIDVIGIQSHMHQGYWGVEKTMQVLENFSRFNLPIHFTETTLVSGQLMPPEIVDLNDFQVSEWPSTSEGEERQAQEVVQHYKTLMAHPLVAGITWWDFTDGGWLKAPAGLVRQDASSKPAYDELLRLVKGEWWLPPTRFGTDGKGQLDFNGFLGDYELSYDGKKYPFTLDTAGTNTIQIQL